MKSIPKGEHVCMKCNGTGTFYGAGVVVNGVFKGFSGKCFGCEGKGWQSKKDSKRNAYYWNHVARISL